MEALKEFEKAVIRTLCAGHISNSTIELALNKPSDVQVKYFGCDYLISIFHDELPTNRVSISLDDFQGYWQTHVLSFIVFIENQTLTLECTNQSKVGCPEDLRQGSIKVNAT